MKVHRDEGVATHIDPEPCVGIREDDGEASVGERTGQPLSRENWINPGANAVDNAEGTRASALPRALARPGVVGDPDIVRKLFGGNRKISRSACGWTPVGPRREDEEL